jgi:hypothetical protein
MSSENKTENKTSHIPTIYHLDINGTSILGDSTEVETPEVLANQIMSRSFFGQLRNISDTFYWVPSDDPIKEDLNSLPASLISHYDFCRLQRKTTYKLYTKDFMTWLEVCYKELYKQVKDKYTLLVEKFKDNGGESVILKSFDKLLAQMDQTDIICFRTFGFDGLTLIPELKKKFPKIKDFVHACIRNDNLIPFEDFKWDISMNDYINLINSTKDEASHKRIDPNSWIIEQYRKGFNIIIHDDWHRWHHAGKDRSKGKQLVHSNSVHQVLFDDNDCVNVVKNDNYNTHCHFIRINTLLALIDEDYYLRLLKKRSCL